jgi:hypothetical protein
MIELVSQDVIRFSAAMSLSDIYSRCPGKALFVEPLSLRMPIAKFIAEGGLGFGSLRNSTFSSKLFKVQTSEFITGSDYSTCVNAGYPLHRLVEGAPHRFCPVPAGEILTVTVPVRERPTVKVLFRSCAITEAKPSPAASDFLWVNDAAAKILGAKGTGAISMFEDEPEDEGEPADEIYRRRFFEDNLPPGQVILKALTMPTNLPRIKELADGSDAFFFALYVHLGVLVILSGVDEKIRQVADEVARLPLTFPLPAVR